MKVLATLVIFFLASGFASRRRDASPGCYDGSISASVCCEGVSDWWVLLPDPADCGRYYQCANGVAVHRNCPGGLQWSAAYRRCEWPQIAGCQVSSTTQASTTPVDNCAAPEVSQECVNGDRSAEKCCRGVQSFYRLEVPNRRNCSTYYQCQDGQAVLRQCPEGLQWSIQSERCEHPEDARCSSNGSNEGSSNESNDSDSDEFDGVSEDCLYGRVSAEECCRGVPVDEDILLQNNDNCHSYIQCVHERPVVRPCPGNLRWSLKKNRCERWSKATCRS